MQKFWTLVVVIIITLRMPAQEENWDTYLAQYNGKPGSVLLDMGLKPVAPLKDFPFVLVTGVRFTNCNTDGMPSATEFDNLYKISDSVQATVKTKAKSKLAGTFTHLCERLDYFYITDTTGLRQILTDLYQSAFPGYRSYIYIKPDTGWTFYLNFLYPNEETFGFMQNQKVVMQLYKAGDKLDQARKTDHWLYFESEKDRNCFMLYAMKQNFKIESTGKDGKLDRPYRLQLSRTDKVDMVSIGKLTSALRLEAKKCNGLYDGWETFVVK